VTRRNASPAYAATGDAQVEAGGLPHRHPENPGHQA
jgi:hypothetical protein